MKLYVDLKGDRHYVVTDDGEATYVDDLEEDGRGTEYLDDAIEAANRRRRRPSRSQLARPLELEAPDPD